MNNFSFESLRCCLGDFLFLGIMNENFLILRSIKHWKESASRSIIKEKRRHIIWKDIKEFLSSF